MKILSIAENVEWISILDNVLATPEYKVSWVADEERLYEQLESVEHSVVCLPHTESYDVYKLCAKISEFFPLATTLLVFQTKEEFEMKKALRAGASDVIFLTSSLSKIKEDIKLAIENNSGKLYRQHKSMPRKNGRVITVASTKGGVGKTTVAVNLAAAFGKSREKVAIVDLDLQFGDVAMFFDVKPKLTMYDWVKEDKVEKQIGNYMTRYKHNISILGAPQRPEFAEVITGENVRNAINELKQQFDIIIIDTSSHMNENSIVALENSDDILLMTYMDLPTLKNSKMLIETLASLQLSDRVKVVLNRQMKVKGITSDTVENVLGKTIFSVIPSMEKAMVTAVNEGRPLGYSNPRSPAARKIFQMAELISSSSNSNSKLDTRIRRSRRMVHAGGHV